MLKLIKNFKVSSWWSLVYLEILTTFNDHSSQIDAQHDDDDNIDAEGVGALLGSWLPFLRTA